MPTMWAGIFTHFDIVHTAKITPNLKVIFIFTCHNTGFTTNTGGNIDIKSDLFIHYSLPLKK